MPIYEDLGDSPEDDRIRRIGEEVSRRGAIVGFVVEDAPKAERYIAKLVKAFPGVRVMKRLPDCPTVGFYTVKVGPMKG